MAGCSEPLPIEVRVKRVLTSRYVRHQRPLSWDERRPGNDVVETVEGGSVRLASRGDQSPPGGGWTIILTGGDAERGFSWTLYGIAPE